MFTHPGLVKKIVTISYLNDRLSKSHLGQEDYLYQTQNFTKAYQHEYRSWLISL